MIAYPEPLPPIGQLRVGDSITHRLHPRQVVHVSISPGSAGHAVHIETSGAAHEPAIVSLESGESTLGPFEDFRVYRVTCDLGFMVVRPGLR